MTATALPHVSRRAPTSDRIPLPPEELISRASGNPEPELFLGMGCSAREHIRAALLGMGRNLESFRSILDFGCGSGRTLRWLTELSSSARLYGTDIDAQAICWCRKNLPWARFSTNRPLPPLQEPSDRFDLIYGISVFAHLREDYQLQWLAELERVTRPNGIVFLTTHGPSLTTSLSPELQILFDTKGFVFATDDYPKPFLPDAYGNAYHSPAYIHETFSRHFKVVDYCPTGFNGHQDIVLLQKEPKQVALRSPSDKALVFLLRDVSGSMDAGKRDLVTALSRRLESVVRESHAQTECVHILYNTEAERVNEATFYTQHLGGGTSYTSALKRMIQILQDSPPPADWNVYGLSFGDGQSPVTDHETFASLLQGDLGPAQVFFFGHVEIPGHEAVGESLRRYLDREIGTGRLPHVHTVALEGPADVPSNAEVDQIEGVVKALFRPKSMAG